MNNPYSDMEDIWNRHLGGERANTAKAILAFLDNQDIGIRKDDGELKQLTVSKAISVTSAFVIGLRYDKRDGTQTEDHFSIERGRPVEPHYRATLEGKWPEYGNTHKQQVIYALVEELQAPITSVSTISVLKRW